MSSNLSNRPECHYHGAYANLAAAIIASGEKCHDTRFLESDWCDTLKEICRLDDKMYGGRSVSMQGRSIVSANKGGYRNEFN